MDPTMVEAALDGWRVAQHRLERGGQRDVVALEAKRDSARAEFQRLSGMYMSDQLDALREAETRRHDATPSTPQFHQAARDEQHIASKIFERARQDDVESPQVDRKGSSEITPT